tara:strand:+ start:17681 stop:18388 length:708 start_codon:yes stop_codon:yes gene_type:complete
MRIITKIYLFLIFSFTLLLSGTSFAQEGEPELGAWYVYIGNTDFKESHFGVMGDVQYRNYSVFSDFQQFIARGAVSYSFENMPLKVATGYGFFNSGTFGESDAKFQENRIHQDFIWSQQLGKHIYTSHRIRLEERFVDDQDFRTRARYMLAIKVPLTKSDLSKNSVYFSGYSEVFINGQKNIGNGRKVTLFDRNWSFAGLGYSISDQLRFEAGYMRETTSSQSKGQLTFTLFQTF